MVYKNKLSFGKKKSRYSDEYSSESVTYYYGKSSSSSESKNKSSSSESKNKSSSSESDKKSSSSDSDKHYDKKSKEHYGKSISSTDSNKHYDKKSSSSDSNSDKHYDKKSSSSNSDKHYGKSISSSDSDKHYGKSISSSDSDKHYDKKSSSSNSDSDKHYYGKSSSSSSSDNSSSRTFYYGKDHGYNFNKHRNGYNFNKHRNGYNFNKHRNRYGTNKHRNRYTTNKCGLVHTGNHGSYGRFLGKFESTIYHGVSIKFKLFEEGIKGHLYISPNIGHKLSAISINKNEFKNGHFLAGPILFWLATSSHWEKGITQLTPNSNYPCCHNYNCNLLAPKGTPYIQSLIGKTTPFSYRFKVSKCKYNCQTLRHFVKNWFVIYGKHFKTIHGGIRKNCHRCGNNGNLKKIGVNALAKSHLNKIILY